jgi:hypothetical protein
LRRPKPKSDSIKIGRFGISYEIPVVFSFVVSVISTFAFIYHVLVGPSVQAVSGSVILSLKENSQYEKDLGTFIIPIIRIAFVNVGNTEIAHVSNEGLEIRVSESGVWHSYEHDAFLKELPSKAADQAYLEDDFGQSTVFSVDQSKMTNKIVAYLPKYDVSRRAAPSSGKKYVIDSMVTNDFIQAKIGDKVGLKVHFKILNSGYLWQFLGFDNLIMQCHAELTYDIMESLYRNRYADSKLVCP